MGQAVGGLAQCPSKMPGIGEHRHHQRLGQGEPVPSLVFVVVAGGRQGTVQLAQEQDDDLFVHHGGCPFTVTTSPLDPASAVMFCSLGDAVGAGLFLSGNRGEQVAVTARARMGHGPRPGEPGAMAARFNTLLGAAGAGR
jgi:hypothetical protein